MKRLVVALLLVAACKERGTITIDLSQTCPAGAATRVRFQVVKNGTCDACKCDICSCETTPDQTCLTDVPCSGSGCLLEDARHDGIDFDPPSAGRYALTYELLAAEPGPTALPVAVFCTVVEVDADGTASRTEMPAPTCCM